VFRLFLNGEEKESRFPLGFVDKKNSRLFCLRMQLRFAETNKSNNLSFFIAYLGIFE
jgi:hypothetical protein